MQLAGKALEQAPVVLAESVRALLLDVERPTTRSPTTMGTTSSEPVDSSSAR